MGKLWDMYELEMLVTILNIGPMHFYSMTVLLKNTYIILGVISNHPWFGQPQEYYVMVSNPVHIIQIIDFCEATINN